MKKVSLTQLAELVGGKLLRETDTQITSVASLEEAQNEQVSFLANKKYASQVATTSAGAVFIHEDFEIPEENSTSAFIATENPNAAFMAAVDFFAPEAIVFPPEIHASAVVDQSATIADGVHIGPNAVVEAGATIASGTVIGAGCYIGHHTSVGSDCLLHANVSIRERCEIHSGVIIHSGTTIGSDGFGFIPGAQGHTKIAQVGNVILEEKVEVGANCCIDRARFGSTVIGLGTKIDNLVQIGHNTKIGRHCFIVSQVGIAGSTVIGNFVTIAGQAGIGGHITIGDQVTVMGQSGVTHSLESKEVVMGSPAIPHKEFIKERMVVKKLQKTLKDLKSEIKELKS